MIDRRVLLYSCALASMLSMAVGSAAEEQWPPQHPWPEQTLRPYGELGKALAVGPGGAFFFRQRKMLDKYRANPELGEQMAKAEECVFLGEGRELTALETMYMLAGRVHDGELGDGYVVFIAAPTKQP
jgi:hypothetical protein